MNHRIDQSQNIRTTAVLFSNPNSENHRSIFGNKNRQPNLKNRKTRSYTFWLACVLFKNTSAILSDCVQYSFIPKCRYKLQTFYQSLARIKCFHVVLVLKRSSWFVIFSYTSTGLRSWHCHKYLFELTELKVPLSE